MKKIILLVSLLLLLCIPAYSYERNTIQRVLSDGEIIKMTDGSVYKISDFDTFTSAYWLCGDDVVITGFKIINIDEDESVEYEYQIR